MGVNEDEEIEERLSREGVHIVPAEENEIIRSGTTTIKELAKPRNIKLKMVGEIDWEQRRYEIARDVLAGLCSNPGDLCAPKEFNGNIYAWSIAIADALIKKLKQETDGQG